MNLKDISHCRIFKKFEKILLCSTKTEVAGEGGPDLAPQEFSLSQQFGHLMRCVPLWELVLYGSVINPNMDF